MGSCLQAVSSLGLGNPFIISHFVRMPAPTTSVLSLSSFSFPCLALMSNRRREIGKEKRDGHFLLLLSLHLSLPSSLRDESR